MRSKPTTKILYKELLVKNRIVNFLLRVANSIFRSHAKLPQNKKFNKILVCNNAHLGDVLLSTVVLPILKKHNPDVTIHFLCGSWSEIILVNNPLVSKVHILDHWKLNRDSKNIAAKFFQFVKTFRKAYQDIRKENYDLAIDLYFHFPNCIYLLWKSNIPVRVAYTSGGFGNLLTIPVPWVYKKQSIADYHLDLLAMVFNITVEDRTSLKPIFPEASLDGIQKVKKLMSPYPIGINNYLVIHPGAGQIRREWPLENWIMLVAKLAELNVQIVFTGYGSREQMLTDQLSKINTRFLNLCGKLTLQETALVIKNSQLLICVDSLAGHIGSAFHTNTIVIGNGLHDLFLWKPLSNRSHYLVHPVICMPCYKGCAGMECLRNIQVEDILMLMKKVEF